VVEKRLSLMLPHKLGRFARDLAIRNSNARNYVGHCRTPISVSVERGAVQLITFCLISLPTRV
jgi:hypothetical protein